MIRKRNLLQTGCVLLAAGMLLSGCGNQRTETAKATGEKDSEEVTIRFIWWGGDDRHKATLDAIDKFEAQNPGIKVKAEYQGWEGIEEKMTTQIAGGTEADLMQIAGYNWVKSYSPDGNGFADMNDFKDIVDLSGYSEQALKDLTVNGKLQGVPYGESGSVLAINKTVYDNLGITEIPKTWVGFKEVAEKFPEGSYPMMVNHDALTLIINSYIVQKTGKSSISDEGKLVCTEADFKDALEWYQGLVDAGALPSYKTVLEAAGTADVSTIRQYIEGEYAGIFSWTATLNSYKTVLQDSGQELEVVDYPRQAEDGIPGITKKPTFIFSISKHSKYPEETAKFLNFLLNDPEGIKALGTTRGIPGNPTAVKILEETGAIDEISKEAFEYMKRTDGIAENAYMQMAPIVEVYDTTLEEFGLGKIDAEEGASKFVKGINAALDQIIK